MSDNMDLKPDNHLAWAIVSTVVFCLPFGIPAIINAAKVDSLWRNGRYEEAEEASEDARKWARIATTLGIIAIALCILYYVVVYLIVFLSLL